MLLPSVFSVPGLTLLTEGKQGPTLNISKHCGSELSSQK